MAKGKLAAFFMHIILYHFVHVLSHCGYGNWAWLCATIVMQELYITYMGRNGGKAMSDICVMIKPASGQCNMKCEYCFYADEMNNRQQASFGMMQPEIMEEVIKKTIRFASSRCTFIFQGGEPVLAGLAFYQQWIECERRYNVNNIEIAHSIQTNGLLLDAEWYQFLRKNNFLVGLSIDGIETTHDAYRKDSQGNGTYKKVLDAARKLQLWQIDFNVLTVVNKETAPQIHHIYDLYKESGFLWQQYIACLAPINTRPDAVDYSVSPDAYGDFLIALFDLWEKDFWNGTQPYIRQFENYIGILLGIEPESCEQKGACGFQMIVEADGSVYPCDFYVLDAYKLGHLSVDDFDSLGQAVKRVDFVKRSYNHAEICLKCEYHFICRGGCCRNREQFGEVYGRNIFCIGYRKFFEHSLVRMKRIAEWVKITRGDYLWNY